MSTAEDRERWRRHQAAYRARIKAGAVVPRGMLRPINHGTPGGYQAHLRRGEPACRECLDAHNTASRLSRERAAASEDSMRNL